MLQSFDIPVDDCVSIQALGRSCW